MKFTDTHCHIYDEAFDNDIDTVINNAFSLGVDRLLLPSIDSSYIGKMEDLIQKHPKKIFGMYGLHPCSVKNNWDSEMEIIESLLFKENIYSPIAIGEIGLDLYWDTTFKNEQIEALKIQINWAKALNLPVVIHVRNAFDEIFEVIDDLNDEKLKGVFHCFTGNLEQAQHIIDYGNFKLGIGGVVTFKNAGLDKTLKQIDLKDIIIETDSPYLAPTPHRGKRNEPTYLPLIAKKIAELKGVSLDQLSLITEKNTDDIFFN